MKPEKKRAVGRFRGVVGYDGPDRIAHIEICRPLNLAWTASFI